MLLSPDEHTRIFPGAQIAWESETHVYELRTHFRNQIPQLVGEIEGVYGSLNGKKVLDLGCGPGRLVEAFPDMKFYLGIDQSQLMIKSARERFPHNFVCGRIEDYRNPNRFDVCTCIDVLQHLQNPPEELLRRILVQFNADIFIFRAYVNAVGYRLVHQNSMGDSSASYPPKYYADMVAAISECTDCNIKMSIIKMPKEQQAGVVYITCTRKPIGSGA